MRTEAELNGRSAPRIRYAVCTTPFGGGGELCALLTDSGRAGAPFACFDPVEHSRASARFGARSFESFVENLESETAGGNGVLGFEIHWPHYVNFFSVRNPLETFPGLRVIRVRRRDRLAQALRWALAEEEQRGAGVPALDVLRVRALLGRIAVEEGEWSALFSGAGFPVLEIEQEELVEVPEVELRRALRWIDVSAAGLRRFERHDPDATRVECLMDWRKRYVAFEERERAEATPATRPDPPRKYAFEVKAHNLPPRIPAGWTHGARLTLVNRSNFPWRSRAIGHEGSFERGEIALVVRENGEWTATHKLPRYEVHPGEGVTIHFALIAPAMPGKQHLTFDLIEWDIAHFQDQGSKPLEHWLEVERPSKRKTAEVQRVARRVNPWHFMPSGGVIEDSEGHLYPSYIVRAKGCKVWDLEGKEYLDYTMANASALLGHADERVLGAIREVMEQVGPMTQLPHPLEVEVSRMLCEDFPCAEMVTFGKNGSDACTVVARLARVFTGKRHILQRGFHGWQDFWAELPGFAEGAIPARPERLIHPFRYGDREGFLRLYEQFKDDLAAVMVEPAAWEGDRQGYAVDEPEFLAFVAEAARDAGALFVLDEIITGFRHPLGSVQKATGIVPDLACVAKALASGMPLAAAIGRADVMRTCMGRIFYPGPTYRGEVYSLAAAKATLEIYRSEPVAAHVNDYGKRLKAGINDLCRQLGVRGRCVGPDFRLIFVFQDHDPQLLRLQRTLYAQELLRRGMLTNIGAMVPSYAHDEPALANTLSIVASALEVVAEARCRGDLEQRIEIPPAYF